MKLTKAQREQLKNKFGGHCAYCGDQLGDKWHADHLAPIYRGHDENKRYEHRGKSNGRSRPNCIFKRLSKTFICG